MVPCLDAADVDNNGYYSSLNEFMELVNWYYGRGLPPTDPGVEVCGPDPESGDLGCVTPPDPCPGVPGPIVADGDTRLAIESALEFFDPGDSVTLGVTLSNDGEEIDAVQFGVCHSDWLALDGLDGIAQGADFPEEIAMRNLSDCDGGWTATLVFASTSSDSLPAGEYELYTATYTVAVATEATVEFCSTLGDPLVQVRVLTDWAPTPVVLESAVVNPTFLPAPDPLFRRGDNNGDGAVSPLLDALFLLSWTYAGGNEPPCRDAADADNDGALRPLLDALFLLDWGFGAGPPLPAPGPDACGEDPEGNSDSLFCEVAPLCS